MKVLDFGLAKAFQPDASDPTLSQSPTISLTAAATQMGMVIGTAAYMVPEQAKGLVVDKRADIWTYGAVLFEMLTGKKLFEAKDVSEMLASVLIKDPDISSIGQHVPVHLRSVIRQCLVKDPRKRLRDVGDVQLAMEGVFAVQPPPIADTIVPGRSRQGWSVAFAAGFVLSALMGGLVWLLLDRPNPVLQVSRFVASAAPSVPIEITGIHPDLALSRDGSRIAYRVGNPAKLYVRPVNRLEGAVRSEDDGNAPFFSPDGTWVGFVDLQTGLKRTSLRDGVTTTVASLDGAVRGASWGSDDRIVFTTVDGQVFRVPAVGGTPEELDLAGAESDHYRWPHVLPGGDAALFSYGSSDLGFGGTGQIVAVDFGTNEPRVVVPNGTQPRYLATGHIAYVYEGTMWVIPFDIDRLQVTGEPVPMVEEVSQKNSGAANFDVADNGTLVYTSSQGTALARSLVWVDRAGREEPINVDPAPYDLPRLSPDGTQVAMEVEYAANMDIYVHDLARQTLTRITTHEARDVSPVWTPDGSRVVFGSNREGGGVFVAASDGSGTVTRYAPATIGEGRDPLTHAWASDEDTLVVCVSGGPTLGDIYTVMGVFPLLKHPLPVVVAFLLPATDTLDHRRVGNGTHRHGLLQEPMEELPAMA